MTAPAVYIHYDYDNKEVSRVQCTEVRRISASTVTLWRLTRVMLQGQKLIMEIRNIVTRAKNLVNTQYVWLILLSQRSY